MKNRLRITQKYQSGIVYPSKLQAKISLFVWR